MTDAAHHLHVYDTNLIMSWTPREFRNFVKGAQLRIVDIYEQMAKQAMFNRYAQNAKQAKESKMFDAKLARKRVMSGDDSYKDSRKIDLTRYRAAKKAMTNYSFRKE